MLPTKSLFASKRAKRFVSDLRRAGVSKKRSKLVAKKFLLLTQPERVGKLVKKNKNTNVYVVSRSNRSGKVLVYKNANGSGKAMVVFAPSRATRRRAGIHK